MENKTDFPRILISATSSGSGKTLITCALLRLLSKMNYSIASFKCGPDYIDPMFHKKVLGIPSRNLDLFLQGEEGVKKAIIRDSKGKNIGIIEGVMGFYDGKSAASKEQSSYDICCKTDTPAILIVNCKGMSNSIIPLIKGFIDYQDKKVVKGVILNNISPMISRDISEAIIENTGIPVVGTLPPLKDIIIESRHLGLMMPSEIDGLLQMIDKAADSLKENLDLDKLLEIAGGAGEISCEYEPVSTNSEEKIRVGIALDEAFCFYYEDNLELLKELGAELVFFSPIHDKEIPDVSRLIFGGGYPELYAKELSENRKMLESIRKAADGGMPILAECGGFLYLQEKLTDPDGNTYDMVGVLSGKSHKLNKLSHFGYVYVTSKEPNTYLYDGEIIRGHEFHYYDTTDNGECCHVAKANGKNPWRGYQVKNKVFAGFAHLYYPSCDLFIKRFLSC